MARTANFAGVMVLLLSISACSSISSLWGGDDDVILPGKRQTVAKTIAPLAPDPAAASLPVILPAAQVNPNWSQPGGTADNAPQHLALGVKLRRIWRKSAGVGSSSQGRLTASPIVAAGKVFVVDTEATVRAFSAGNGRLTWTRALTPKGEESDEGFGGGIASDGTRVYATTGFGEVIALEAGSGRIVWRRKIETPIRAAPTVAGGQVFVTTVNNEVFSLSTQDGSITWKFSGVAETAGLLTSTSPAVSGNRVVMPYTSGDLIAFDAVDGRPLWNDNLTRTGRLSAMATLNTIAGRPVIHRGAVYAIAQGGRLLAVDLQSGKRLWSREVSGIQTPWLAGGYMFVISEDNRLIAISAAQGLVRWIRKLPAGADWSGPILAGGRLITVADNGKVMNIAPQSGEVVGQFDIDEKIFISPVVANGVIYFYTDDADLIAMR